MTNENDILKERIIKFSLKLKFPFKKQLYSKKVKLVYLKSNKKLELYHTKEADVLRRIRSFEMTTLKFIFNNTFSSLITIQYCTMNGFLKSERLS